MAINCEVLFQLSDEDVDVDSLLVDVSFNFMSRLKVNRHKKQKKLAAFFMLWLHILNIVSWYIRAVQTAISWEGSAADGRILRSAMIRENGMQVPKDMESQLDHERGPGKNKKKRNEKEDEKLVASMLDVLNSGSNYKSDNGFKPGFINAVEQQLAILLPGAGIKAKPHIESRIKTMKSDWSAVHDMLSWNNTSGFGWDYNNDMLDAPQPVWQAYIHVLYYHLL
ncbi:hypothetical protein L1987_63430 [Smallanthus sonchifolius]|uniref:Uncharacterized protein n=1 Tax=Smallanthus sonchifolius TaxID=185202 RepID=A0ACB9CD94_9ASTR|nr:hypothetical protein L1987_63430 [Smallanthus sonchifolius]